jgi:hypothetical protein
MFRSQLQLNLQRVFAVGPEDSTYIFDMAGSSDTKTLAVSASNHCIKLYDMASLSYTSQLTGLFSLHARYLKAFISAVLLLIV